MTDADLDRQLALLDPVATDPPPTPGSNRYQTIKEHAMSTPITAAREPNPGAHRRHRAVNPNRRRPAYIAAAATVAVLIVGGVAVLWPGATPVADAAPIREAARNSAAVTDFRVTMSSDSDGVIPGGVAHGEVDGNNHHLVAEGFEYHLVDGIEWMTQDGVSQSRPAEDPFMPFGQASELLIEAALASESVFDAGTQQLDDVTAHHYRINVDDAARDALALVPSSAQYWFVGAVSEEVVGEPADGQDPTGGEGEPAPAGERFGFLEDATEISIWVADDLIHQIEVDSDGTGFTYRFYDFGADITIMAPE